MNRSLVIAVCLPSRGMMHSRTVEDVITNLLSTKSALGGLDYYFCMSHGLPQPKAQNYITQEALYHHPDYIWYVDDDMHFESRTLEVMLELDVGVVVADYPVAKNKPTVHIRDGKFETAGMGCVLIKPEILRRLEEPYFRTDTQYVWEGDHLTPYPVEDKTLQRHGGHDVDFWQRLLKAGVEPAIVKIHAGQYYLIDDRIKKWGNNTNQEIELWQLPRDQ